MQPIAIADVLLDDAIDRTLDYKIPEVLQTLALPGARVVIPVRGKLRKGTIVSLKSSSSFTRLFSIEKMVQDEPLIPQDLLQLSSWMSRYYCCDLRKVLQAMLPAPSRDMEAKTQLFIRSALSKNGLQELCYALREKAPAQAKLLDELLQAPQGLLLSELLERSGGTHATLKALLNKKCITAEKLECDRSHVSELDYFQTKPKSLNAEQSVALERIVTTIRSNSFSTHLLHGVTGSGKTEVYLQAIQEALESGKGVIFLVPEVSLTAQTVERLSSRFPKVTAVIHHRLSAGERRDSWHKIRKGEAKIVIGARSALLTPVVNLGLIIVDEEHDGAYKQSPEQPCYHARDVAVMRGKFSNATVVLGSATPSIESYYNAHVGKYILSSLEQRADHALLPHVSIVDLKHERDKAKGGTLFSEILLEKIEKRLKIGEQTLLLLNRRGYHTCQLCTQCKKTVSCPSCDISLTFHLEENALICHLCAYKTPLFRSCPHCNKEESMRFSGAGTELIEKSLHAIFPTIRTLRLDADTTRHKGSHEKLFKQFRSGKADLLIGTQMIAKGLHFPAVTLVGILQADMGLQIPDFRAGEQTFQLITQVSGRSGRGALPGEVVIQTMMPHHPLIQMAQQGDYASFYNSELPLRKQFNYPPFCQLIKLQFSGASESDVRRKAESVRKELIDKLPPNFQILPPTPSGHAKIQNQFRFQFLIKGEKRAMPHLTEELGRIQAQMRAKKDVQLVIDVDPLSTYF